MIALNPFGPMTYVEQKLWQAVNCLNGEGDLSRRLEGAAIALVELQPANFSDPAILKAWRDIKQDLTVDDPQWSGEGAIEATTRNLSGSWARGIEKRIRELHARVYKINFDATVERDRSIEARASDPPNADDLIENLERLERNKSYAAAMIEHEPTMKRRV